MGIFDPAWYVVVVQGALEEAWSARLSGLAIAVCETPNGPRTTLTGLLPDQAALQAVLTTLYDLGLPVRSVVAM